jgi:hypothetical protein
MRGGRHAGHLPAAPPLPRDTCTHTHTHTHTQTHAEQTRPTTSKHTLHPTTPPHMTPHTPRQDTNRIVQTLEFGIALAMNVLFLLLYLAVWRIDV